MMADRLDELLILVRPPEVDPAFMARLNALPLHSKRSSIPARQWLRYLLPLPLAAAVAGFAVGVLTSSPTPIPLTVDLLALGGGSADTVVVELLEDILWPYESPVTLASY